MRPGDQGPFLTEDLSLQEIRLFLTTLNKLLYGSLYAVPQKSDKWVWNPGQTDCQGNDVHCLRHQSKLELQLFEFDVWSINVLQVIWNRTCFASKSTYFSSFRIISWEVKGCGWWFLKRANQPPHKLSCFVGELFKIKTICVLWWMYMLISSEGSKLSCWQIFCCVNLSYTIRSLWYRIQPDFHLLVDYG